MALLSLRPIYTEELPGVAAHDSLFVLLRPGVAEPCTSTELPDAIKQTRIVRGYSWQLLSVDWPLQLRIEVVQSFKKIRSLAVSLVFTHIQHNQAEVVTVARCNVHVLFPWQT